LRVVGFDKHKSSSGCLWSVKKNGRQSIGKSRGGNTTKIHILATDADSAVDFMLTSGNEHDAPAGRILLETVGVQKTTIDLLMDRAYEDYETRKAAALLHFNPIVPPKKNRREPWDYDTELYKKRNEVERLFRKIKAFRRVFTRYDKLDKMFSGFIYLALVFIAIN
jgi:transposase